MHSASRTSFVGVGIALALFGCRSGDQDTLLDEGPGSNAVLLHEARLVDLTYAFDSTSVYWPTAEPFHLDRVSYGPTPGGWFYAANRFCAAEHGGTHLDAPIHFAEGRWTVDEIPLQQLMGPAVVIDVSDSVNWNPDYRLTVPDILAWEERHGPMPGGSVVLLRTGWSKHWPDPQAYFGSSTPADTRTLHFPGFTEAAAQFLTKERIIDAVGLDTPSLDAGQALEFPAHRIFSEANIPGFENVANLHRLPEQGAWVLALPMKIGGGTGAPLRIFGILPPEPAVP